MRLAATFLALGCYALAQNPGVTADPPVSTDAAPERWNLYYQATSIGQYHGTFDQCALGDYTTHDAAQFVSGRVCRVLE